MFTPLTTLAFATLPPQLRTEAAGIFSLMRNIGASIGISVVETLLARSIQVNHAEIAEHVNPYSAGAPGAALPTASGIRTRCRPGDARSRDQPPGRDDRLYRRLQVHDGGDPRGRAAAAAAASGRSQPTSVEAQLEGAVEAALD